MKKSLLLVAFLGVSLAYKSASAQLRISASVNFNTQPAWIPSGYPAAENYYFPEQDIYYDMAVRQYRYMDRGRWVCSPDLPYQYRNMDLYRARKVVINERNPYLRNDYWKARYRDNRRDFNRPDYRNNGRPGRDRQDWAYRDNSRNDQHNNGRYSEHRGDDRGHK